MNYSVALLLVVLIYSRYAEVAEAARGRQRNRQHTQSSSEAQTTVGKLGNRRTLTKTTTKKEATVEPTQQLINDSPEHDGRKLSDLPSNVDLTYPPCIANESDLGYINGRLSFEETFLNCLNNIADVGSLPTLDNGNLNGTMQVGTNIVLNNLHEIDAVTGSATMDFYLRLYWQDNRFNMTLFWNKVSPKLQSEGFYLTSIIDDDNNKLFWQPDIRFHDVSGYDVLAQTMRINASNVFFWSRHILGDFMQPMLKFEDYPNDNQTLHLRYGSYAFNKDYLNLYVVDSGVGYNKNYNGDATFTTNPVWEHAQSWNRHQIYTSSSGFTNVVFDISVARTSTGILVRLVIPVTILTIIGGMIFWSHPKERVNLTVTLLLSVAAMYVVIIGNIPLVGYLTAVDRYCFMMFVVLAAAIVFHQIYYVLLIRTEEDETDALDRAKRIEEANMLRTHLTEEDAQLASLSMDTDAASVMGGSGSVMGVGIAGGGLARPPYASYTYTDRGMIAPLSRQHSHVMPPSHSHSISPASTGQRVFFPISRGNSISHLPPMNLSSSHNPPSVPTTPIATATNTAASGNGATATSTSAAAPTTTNAAPTRSGPIRQITNAIQTILGKNSNTPTKKEMKKNAAISKFKLLSVRDRILYDFRSLICKIMETLGRLCVAPFAILAFWYIFEDSDQSNSTGTITAAVIVAIFFAVVLSTELSMIISDVQSAKKNFHDMEKLVGEKDAILKVWRMLFRFDSAHHADGQPCLASSSSSPPSAAANANTGQSQSAGNTNDRGINLPPLSRNASQTVSFANTYPQQYGNLSNVNPAKGSDTNSFQGSLHGGSLNGGSTHGGSTHGGSVIGDEKKDDCDSACSSGDDSSPAAKALMASESALNIL